MEWIRDDELAEVTPKSIRVRKAILDIDKRKRAERKQPALDESFNALQSRVSA